MSSCFTISLSAVAADYFGTGTMEGAITEHAFSLIHALILQKDMNAWPKTRYIHDSNLPLKRHLDLL